MAKKPKTVENTDLLERGQKQRAGRVISEYIRAVGQEIDQVVDVECPGEKGPPRIKRRLVSKAEALARFAWEKALPRREADGTITAPDLDYVKLVLERAEGRPGVQGQEDTEQKESVPQKISRMNAERVNAISAEVMGE